MPPARSKKPLAWERHIDEAFIHHHDFDFDSGAAAVRLREEERSVLYGDSGATAAAERCAECCCGFDDDVHTNVWDCLIRIGRYDRRDGRARLAGPLGARGQVSGTRSEDVCR